MRKVLVFAAVAALIALQSASPEGSRAQPPGYDLLLRNARVVDGGGGAPYRADVAVRGETIVTIAPSIKAPATRVVDIGGKVLAPGFIDVHNHGERRIFIVPTADNFVRQGVTTIIGGPDGASAVPLGQFLTRLSALPRSVNIGSFVGQGSVRAAVMGRVNRPATPEEIDQMRGIVEQAMKDGAFGLSSGLIYVPGVFTPTAEIIELAKVAGRFGGHYQSHIRSEGSRVVEAVREAIDIGEKGHLSAQMTHHKIVGDRFWGRSVEALRLVDEARARGIDVTIDQYPYTSAGGDIGATLLPAWALEGSRDVVVQRLRDPEQRARIKGVIQRNLVSTYIREMRNDLSQLALSSCRWDQSLAGKSLGELAKARGAGGFVENAAEAAMWIVEKGGCGLVNRDLMSEADVERIIRHPVTMIASDGEMQAGPGEPNAGAAHPRDYGTFPRVLAVYVRDRKLLTLQEAIRKMTALPARRLGLKDRGLVQQGMKADLVVLDPTTVRDAATNERPNQFPEGIPIVVVNGQIVFENGAMTPARPGQVLYGPGKAARPGAPPDER